MKKYIIIIYIIHLKKNAIMILVLVNKFIENKKCTDTICINLDKNKN